MTKAFLEKRLVDLKAQREQAIGTINALIGAIQDCEYILAHFDTPEEAAPSPVPNGADLEAHA